MNAPTPHDAIAPEAVPAVEALEKERGTLDDFKIADAELQRLERHFDSRNLAHVLLIVAVTIAFGIFERPYDYVVSAALFIALAVFTEWWKRTPRARAIKRVKQAVHDWLAFGPTTHDA